MNIYPNFYLNSIIDITIDFLKKNNIKGLILDVDNTLIDFDKKLLDGTEEWVTILKKNNISLEKAMQIYYQSKLANWIHSGEFGVQYLDSAVLVELLEKEN